MATYLYTAITPEGDERRGEVEAASPAAVVRQLQDSGLIPLSVDPAPEASAWRVRGRPGLQVQNFSRELAELMQAGIALDRALQIMLRTASDSEQQRLLKRIQDSVQRGQPLSTALQQQGRLFSPFYLSMMRAAESAGNLTAGLREAAIYLERSRALREKLLSALIYPVILLVVALLSLAIILTYVIPQFEQLFADMGEALPLATRVVIAIADGVRNFGPWVLLLLVLGYLLAKRQLREPDVRLAWHRRVLLWPLLGGLLARIETARFSRSLGTLLKGGVALVAALQLARDSLGNEAFRATVDDVTRQVREGRRLGEQLQHSGLFPLLAVQMIQVGEEAGQLDQALLNVADRYDREVEVSLQRLLTLLEPILIVGLGVLIAGMIMSILVAIMSINQLPL
ncbi:type II secretion system F family protein [Marinobacterium weihaiense]|uniref:Type II secretion system F family protein n=1 Tax=Marinobacterium weihaiense TaxID=2851016 RepID=A0ABS6MDG7_9GAMM|nr:type II secretion system F family protein [Marinobacterium weihaiense]MBV0934270.1 type II secretion system F family protein [Marinobacterium weihaiense]